MTNSPSTPFRYDNRSYDVPPDHWQAGDDWGKRYTDPVNEDRDRSVEDYVTSRVGQTLALINQRTQSQSVTAYSANPALVVDGAFGSIGAAGAQPTVTCTTGTRAIVMGTANVQLDSAANNRAAGVRVSYAVSGATTVVPTVFAPAFAWVQNNGAGILVCTISFTDVISLTAGVNVFTMQFQYTRSVGMAGLGSPLVGEMNLTVFPLDDSPTL